MRTSWVRLSWMRLRAGWVTLTGTGAAASIAFGLLVFASVLASLAIPRESAGLRTAALQRVIATSRASDQTVIGTTGETSLPYSSDDVVAGDIAAAGAALRARLSASGVPVAGDAPLWSSLTTGYVVVSGAAQPAGYGQPQFEMTYRTGLARYSQVVAGRLPVGGHAAGERDIVQVAVTTTTAARFGLRVGTRLNVGPQVQLVVTGIIRPANPASAFWTRLPAATQPLVAPAAAPRLPYWMGAVFLGPGALPLIEAGLGTDGDYEMVVSWVYGTALGRLTAGQAGGVVSSVTSLVSSGATLVTPGTTSPVTVAISSQIPYILSPFIAGENAVAPVLELLYVSLAVLGAVVVLLGARLVAQRRAAEFTLMRARGAALYQLGWLVLRASVIIAAVAGAAAVALAIGLTRRDADAVGWWLAGVTIAVTILGPVLISVVPQRVAAPEVPAGGWTGGRTPAARRIVIEATLVAVAIGGLVVLRNQGLSSASNGLYTSAAPVLVAIPVAVVVLRCYPPLARELARLAGLSRGVVAFVGLARATRTPPGTVLPSFALVLVLAMVAFPDMVATSVTGSQVAASWRQVGTDAIIQAPPRGGISQDVQNQISSVPGVVATATLEVADGALSTGTDVPVVFTDPAQYAAVIDRAPGPRFPAGALSGYPGSGTPGIVPAVATASAAAELGGPAPASLVVGNITLTIQLAGQISGVPGVGSDAIVLPALSIADSGASLELVSGPGLDTEKLNAIVASSLPGGSVTTRAAALAALTTAPVPQAARTALTQGLVAAAGFGALVLMLSLLLTARTREMTLARLATMGLRRWQAQLLLATETLPPVVAAAAGGVGCAWLLVPLVGPSLDLAAFGGTGSAIVVTPAAFPLAASAAGLVLAALLALASSAVITYHRGSARALRIAD